MKKGFRYIPCEFDKLSDNGKISAYDRRVIRELSKEVIDFIAVKYNKVKKGIGDIMCGPMIETDARKFVKIGEEKGRKEGIEKGRKEGEEKGRKEMIEALKASGASEELIQAALKVLEEKKRV